MIFREELAEAIMRGEKTATRRRLSDNSRSPWWKEKCAYEVGQIFTINPGRGVKNIGAARVTAVYKQAPLMVTVSQTREEGFESIRDFWATLRQINPDIDLKEPVWVVEFTEPTPAASKAREGG